VQWYNKTIKNCFLYWNRGNKIKYKHLMKTLDLRPKQKWEMLLLQLNELKYLLNITKTEIEINLN